VDVVLGPTTQVGAGADEVGLIGGSDIAALATDVMRADP